MIGGQPAPKEWMGGLNVTYNMGPELMKPGWKIKLEVHNENKIVPGHNVMGYIYGSEEPDRYLLKTQYWKKILDCRVEREFNFIKIDEQFEGILCWGIIEMLGFTARLTLILQQLA